MLVHFPPIRSFVRREGRMTIAQRTAFEKLWSLYGLTLDSLAHQESDQRKFVVEVGFGMGHSLLAMAEQFPNYQFLGIDIYRPGIGSVLQAIDTKKLQNVRLLREDAVEVLAHLGDRSVDILLIFFPDPWPKKRHHKRRLIQPAFMNGVIQKLKIGGYLHIATDWEDYANHIAAVLDQFPCLGIDDHKNAPEGKIIPRKLTKFEQRGKNLGHKIYEFVRVFAPLEKEMKPR